MSANSQLKRFCGMNRTIWQADDAVIVPGRICLRAWDYLRTGAIAKFSR